MWSVLARFSHAPSDPTRARLLLSLRDAPGYPAEPADLLGLVLAVDPQACPDSADQGCC